MGQVVPIDRGKFLGDYIARQTTSTIPEWLFLGGVLATFVVPQVLYCAIGGPLPPWVFVVTAQTGVIAALANQNWPPADPPSIVSPQTEPISQGGRTRHRKLS